MAATTQLRRAIRRVRPQLLYPSPASSLQPERLYRYLDVLYATRTLRGAVVEIGCWLGGTASIASRFLDRIGCARRYVCVDTFSGFVAEHFEADGAPASDRGLFDESSAATVRTLLDHWGAPRVELLEGDICEISPDQLPERIAVCLVDVDLEVPVHASLAKIVPRMTTGGIVLVDDCPESTSWVGARRGYERFCEDVARDAQYEFGLGVIQA